MHNFNFFITLHYNPHLLSNIKKREKHPFLKETILASLTHSQDLFYSQYPKEQHQTHGCDKVPGILPLEDYK